MVKQNTDGEQNHAESTIQGRHVLLLWRGRGIHGLCRRSIILLGIALLARTRAGRLLSAGPSVRLRLGKRLRLALSVRLALLRVKSPLRRRRLRRLLRLLVRVVFSHGCALSNVNGRTREYTLLMVTKTLAVAAVTSDLIESQTMKTQSRITNKKHGHSHAQKFARHRRAREPQSAKSSKIESSSPLSPRIAFLSRAAVAITLAFIFLHERENGQRPR